MLHDCIPFSCLNFTLTMLIFVPHGYNALFVSIYIVWWIQRIDHYDESSGVQRWKSLRYDLHWACIGTWSYHLWPFDPVGPPRITYIVGSNIKDTYKVTWLRLIQTLQLLFSGRWCPFSPTNSAWPLRTLMDRKKGWAVRHDVCLKLVGSVGQFVVLVWPQDLGQRMAW